MEIIFEILGEFFLELYLTAAVEFLPENKLKKRHKILLQVLAAVVSLGVFFMFLIGVIIVADKSASPLTGICLISGGIIILAAQVLLYVYLHKRQSKRNKALQDQSAAEAFNDGNRREY